MVNLDLTSTQMRRLISIPEIRPFATRHSRPAPQSNGQWHSVVFMVAEASGGRARNACNVRTDPLGRLISSVGHDVSSFDKTYKILLMSRRHDSRDIGFKRCVGIVEAKYHVHGLDENGGNLPGRTLKIVPCSSTCIQEFLRNLIDVRSICRYLKVMPALCAGP